MIWFDIARMACYVVVATTLVIRALEMRSAQRIIAFLMYLSFALFFAWLVFEAMLTSMGGNRATSALSPHRLLSPWLRFRYGHFFFWDRTGDPLMIDRIPGAVWPIVYTAIYLGLHRSSPAQWPDTPPSYILGAMVTLGALQGLLNHVAGTLGARVAAWRVGAGRDGCARGKEAGQG